MNVPKRKRSVIAFTDALCRLACDTPIRKITVTGICDEAGYTSMAFYSSFENKYDFVNSIIDHEAQIFACCVYNRLEQADQLYGTGKTQNDLHRLYMTDFFQHVDENRMLYHCILNDLIARNGIEMLSGRIAHYMRLYLTLRADGRPEIPNFTAFVLETTQAQMLMVARYWVGRMPDMDPQSAAELYCDQFLFRRMVPIERDPESGGFQASL